MSEDNKKIMGVDKSWLADVGTSFLGAVLSIVATFGTQFWIDSRAQHEKYVKITAATIVNIERYMGQLNEADALLEEAEQTYDALAEMSAYGEQELDTMYYLFPEVPLNTNDKWIEENFIGNGDVIEDTDLRFKIGQAYSYKDICLSLLSEFKTARDKQFDSYVEVWSDDNVNYTAAVSKLMKNKSLQRYYIKLSLTRANLSSYIGVLEEVYNDIKKSANISDEQLEAYRSSYKKLDDVTAKQQQ